MRVKFKEGWVNPSVLSRFNPLHTENQNSMFSESTNRIFEEMMNEVRSNEIDAMNRLSTLMKQYSTENHNIYHICSYMFHGDNDSLYLFHPKRKLHKSYMHARVVNSLEKENSGNYRIILSSEHRPEKYTIFYQEGTMFIRFDTDKIGNFNIPILENEEEYIQMQVLYPCIKMNFQEAKVLREICEVLANTPYEMVRYRTLRFMFDISKSIFLALLIKLKILKFSEM